jgi:catalase (peroxidase I)
MVGLFVKGFARQSQSSLIPTIEMVKGLRSKAKQINNRGRNKGASICMEPSKSWRVNLQGKEKIPLVPIIGKERMTR